MGAGLLVSVFVARYLGPERFGLLNFAVALVALFSAIASGGLGSILVRDLVARPEARASMLASALVLRLAGAALAIALVLGANAILRAGDVRSEWIVCIVALASLPQAWDVIDYDYQSRMLARPIVLIRGISFAASAVLRVALVLAGAALYWFACAVVCEAVLNALLLNRRSRLEGAPIHLAAATWRESRRLLTTSWPLVIAGLSVSVYMRIDQVMLGQMLGDADVGLFSAAVRISEALYFLPVAVAASVAPALTAAYLRANRDYEVRFVHLTRLLVWTAILLAVVFAIFSGPIIGVLYGARFASAAAILAIHAWAGVFVSLGVCGTLWMTNAGFFKYLMAQTLVGALTNVAVNVLLIPRFGPQGAAVATCCGQFAAVFITIAVLRETRPLLRLQLKALIPGSLWPPGWAVRP